MHFRRLNRHLLSVKDTCSQCSFCFGFLEDLWEVLHLSGTTGGNDRDGDVIADVVDQFNVETTIGAILIKQIMESLVT